MASADSNNCNFFWNIGGKVYLDYDSSCSQTFSEPGLENIHILLSQGGNVIQQAFTTEEGFYSFDVNVPGIYDVSVDTSGIPFDEYCHSNLYIDTLTLTDTLKSGNDFAMQCKSTYDLAAINFGSISIGLLSSN